MSKYYACCFYKLSTDKLFLESCVSFDAESNKLAKRIFNESLVKVALRVCENMKFTPWLDDPLKADAFYLDHECHKHWHVATLVILSKEEIFRQLDAETIASAEVNYQYVLTNYGNDDSNLIKETLFSVLSYCYEIAQRANKLLQTQTQNQLPAQPAGNSNNSELYEWIPLKEAMKRLKRTRDKLNYDRKVGTKPKGDVPGQLKNGTYWRYVDEKKRLTEYCLPRDIE